MRARSRKRLLAGSMVAIPSSVKGRDPASSFSLSTQTFRVISRRLYEIVCMVGLFSSDENGSP